MKLMVCVKNNFENVLVNLTVGNLYTVTKEKDEHYLVKNDGGATVYYPIKLFREFNADDRQKDMEDLIFFANSLDNQSTLEGMLKLCCDNLGFSDPLTVWLDNLYHRLVINIAQKELFIKYKYGNTLREMVCEGR